MILGSEFTASIAVILPLIGAGPICLEVKAPNNEEVTFTCAKITEVNIVKKIIDINILVNFIFDNIKFIEVNKKTQSLKALRLNFG